MATFDAWYDDVLPYVDGCPPALALQKIREAAIAFAKMSRSWRYRALTPIDSVAGQQSYVIGTGASVGTLPANTVVAHVYQVNWLGEVLDYATPAAFRDLSETWFADQGDPETYTLFAEGEVSLWQIPTANTVGAIVIPEVALAPSQTATGTDSSFFEKYRSEIALGARGLIHQVPKKPYSDMQLASALMQAFNVAAGSAELRASSGRGRARLRSQTIIR